MIAFVYIGHEFRVYIHYHYDVYEYNTYASTKQFVVMM